MSLSWIAVLSFIIFIAINAVGSIILIRVKKQRYSNLWNKDKKKGTFWNPYDRQLIKEIMWNTPFWINQEKDAKIWLSIMRLSIIPILIS